LVDAAISGKLGVTMVITNKEHGDKWRAELGLTEQTKRGQNDCKNQLGH
jgi:hypothetical protein